MCQSSTAHLREWNASAIKAKELLWTKTSLGFLWWTLKIYRKWKSSASKCDHQIKMGSVLNFASQTFTMFCDHRWWGCVHPMAITLGLVLPLRIQQAQLRNEIFISATHSGTGLQNGQLRHCSCRRGKRKGDWEEELEWRQFSQRFTHAAERFLSQLGNQDTFFLQGET